jgi:hypothetical protein
MVSASECTCFVGQAARIPGSFPGFFGCRYQLKGEPRLKPLYGAFLVKTTA